MLERRYGILLMCGAILIMACLDTTAKYLGRHLPIMEVVWARYTGATVIILAASYIHDGRLIAKTSKPFLQFLRSLLMFCSTVMIFLAFQTLQLAEVTSISFAMPLLVSLLSGPILGEPTSVRRLAPILCGFIGILIALPPFQSSLDVGVVFAVGSLVCYSFYNILTRIVAKSDHPNSTALFTSISGVAFLTPVLPFFWIWPADALLWILLFLAGLFGAVSHFLLIVAHGKAPAHVLAPFAYSQIVWNIIFGLFIFNDTPSWNTIIGVLIVICSGLYLLYLEY